jgi:hypothetical protein
MKNLSFLLLTIVLLVSCSEVSEKNLENDPISDSEISIDSVDITNLSDLIDFVDPNELLDSEDSIPEVDPLVESFSLKARFVEFHLGDAEHYIFEDESGERWDFSGAESEMFDFTSLLDESEMDESNQGWGSNTELQDKWFDLTYIKREQPQYQDGPMAIVEIISEAVLVE